MIAETLDKCHNILAEPEKPMRVAIQGELGSNSHMAVNAMLEGRAPEIVSCSASANAFEHLAAGTVDAAVLPIENSLHGSVAEHYDLLLASPVRIAGESLLRIHHNVIAAPGTRLSDLRRVLSHPVALSQCRHWLARHPEIEAVNFYDTAGSVKYLMAAQLKDTGGIAPSLAAEHYGGKVLVTSIEDHAENYTRFHLLLRQDNWQPHEGVNKSSVAFSVVHQPGTLVKALEEFARAGVNLTKIESRPVHGTPWEYVFFADLRFESGEQIDGAITAVEQHCRMFKELGRYRAA